MLSLKAQGIPVTTADQLLQRLQNGGDTTFVINFWATWCAPCVAELPYFEQLNESPADEKIKVLLISLDFRKDYQTRLPAFIQKRNIRSEVGWLDERDANEWVPKFSEAWSGAIPATLVFNAHKQLRAFRPSAFEEGELQEWLRGMGAMENK